MLEEKYLNVRTRALRRHNDKYKALRKKKISDNYSVLLSTGTSWYKDLHRYSKGKIHCSCPMCRAKTKNKGRRRKGSYAPSYNPTISECRINDSMLEQLEEFYE